MTKTQVPILTFPYTFGVRPGHPIVLRLSCLGTKPIQFGVTKETDLPAGVFLVPNEDGSSAQLNGFLRTPGNYSIEVVAENEQGKDVRTLTLMVGEEILLTPMLGWCSWNCFGPTSTTHKIFTAGKALKDLMGDYGYTYVNIDDGWQGERSLKSSVLWGNEKFPDMRGLTDDLHDMGMKVGIYSTPWVNSYAGYTGGSSNHWWGADTEPTPEFLQAQIQPTATDCPSDARAKKRKHKGRHVGRFLFDYQDAMTWASWGFDSIKYDWHPITVLHAKRMHDGLRSSGRDIVLSLSNTADLANAEGYAAHSQMWRTANDLHDQWDSVTNAWAIHERWRKYQKPGSWNDPDMLVVGRVGWGGQQRANRLTLAEQGTHVALWSLWSAPMLLGCNMQDLRDDPDLLDVLQNATLIEINQDILGIQAKTFVGKIKDGDVCIGTKPMACGRVAISATWTGKGSADEVQVNLRDCVAESQRMLHEVLQRKPNETIYTPDSIDRHYTRFTVTDVLKEAPHDTLPTIDLDDTDQSKYTLTITLHEHATKVFLLTPITQ
eukprot:Clim_evm7s34 gene=Clim_evmTU7s34